VIVVVAVAIAKLVTTGHHQARPKAAAAAGAAPSLSTQLGGSHFAPGACVAMSPKAGGNHQTVFLDAGHGGPDPGAAGTTTGGQTVDERDLTLPVVLDAASSLRAAGYRAVVSRTGDTSVARLGPADLTATGTLSVQGEHDDTEARVTCANLSGAGVLISVHFNAFSDPTAAGLLTTYDDSRPFAAANQHLAQTVDTDVVDALYAAGWQVTDRGIQSDTIIGAPSLTAEAHAYGHLLLLGPAAPGWLAQPTIMPGALIEPLFLTNPAEASIAADPAGQRAIAAGIVAAVTATVPSTPATTGSG
jgi:N-acetylmuramoyl-L-alanine amidase